MYETLIVDVKKTDFTKSPFKVLLDFSFSSVSNIALKFFINLSYMAGKLTKLAPIPKPAPERALTAKLGK